MNGNFWHGKELEVVYYRGWVQDELAYVVPLVLIVEIGYA